MPSGTESTDAPAPLFLSVSDAARLLSISDDLVYELISRDEIPAARFGRRLLVPRAALDLVVDHLLDGFDPARVAGIVVQASAEGRPSP